MYKVGIVGLGKIAAMYETPNSKKPYCHAGGILQSNRVKLQAVADISESAQKKFENVWGAAFPGLNYYDNAGAMLEAEELDIVAVCVKGPAHYKVMMEVLSYNPRVIFLEKPPSCSLEEMDEMLALSIKKGIPITVSYSRHWDPVVLRMQELVLQGIIGKVKTVIGYSGGLVLSGNSHTIDLICQFAGYCPTAVYARGTVNKETPEGYEPEPETTGMIIEFEDGITGVVTGSSGEYGHYYCEAFGTEGSIKAGMYTEPVVRNAKGEIQNIKQFDIPERQSVFKVAYDQIADYLDGQGLPDCTDDSFIKVNEICFGAVESIYTDKRIVLPNINRKRRIFANW